MDFRQLGAAGFLLVAVVACTARGYSGPARSAEEISTVTLSKLGEIRFEALVFDEHDVSALANNVQLLPGNHKFHLRYVTEEPDPSCDESDFLCTPIVKKGVCEGRISTLAGRTYLVTVESQYSLVDLRVGAKGYFDFSERADEASPGSGACRETLSY